MTIGPKQRSVILALLLAATLAVTAVSSNEPVDDGVVRPVVRTQEMMPAEVRPTAKSVVTLLDLGRLERSAEEVAVVDVFAPQSWVPPPPKVTPVVSRPADPVLPALPFRYVGQLEESDGKAVIYLARGDEVYTVRPGDVLETQYRVDAVDAAQITLTYLPMNRQQMLAIPPR